MRKFTLPTVICVALSFLSLSIFTCYVLLTFALWERRLSERDGTSPLIAHHQQFCRKNMLNLRDYDNKMTHSKVSVMGTVSDRRFMMSKLKHDCRLMHYTSEHVAKCFDFLARDQSRKMDDVLRGNIIAKDNRKRLHFAFIGDSRTRHQFTSFLQLIPDYDIMYKGRTALTNKFQEDVEITSNVLNLRLTFKWRPYLDLNVTNIIHDWMMLNGHQLPHWILMGMGVWSMLGENNIDFQTHLKNISLIAPVLNELAAVTKVIWLNQYPVVELYAKTDDRNVHIFSEKIDRYNEILHDIFRNYSRVHIWDSSNRLAEEYVRSCILLPRQTISSFALAADRNCRDFVHTGYAALAEATQLLLNDLCNANAHE